MEAFETDWIKDLVVGQKLTEQYETLIILRGYANEILRQTDAPEGAVDIRPSTALQIFRIVSRMHNLKDRLTIK